MNGFAGFLFVGADRAADAHSSLGTTLSATPAWIVPEADDGAFGGVAPSGADGLQRVDDLGGDPNRIQAKVRRRAMTSLRR